VTRLGSSHVDEIKSRNEAVGGVSFVASARCHLNQAARLPSDLMVRSLNLSIHRPKERIHLVGGVAMAWLA
jgi:hypothetical protein